MDNEALIASFGVHLEGEAVNDKPIRWTDCEDLEIFDDAGEVVWAGPRYFRCGRAECHVLVTHGMIATGGCLCGNRRLLVAMRLTSEERSLLKRGYYPLVEWERHQIQPVLPQGKNLGWGREHFARLYGRR